MSSVALTIGTPCAPPRLVARVLATCVRPSRDDARAFCDLHAETWRHALEPGEQRFVAIAHDRHGRVAFVRCYEREHFAPATEHGRSAMRGSR